MELSDFHLQGYHTDRNSAKLVNNFIETNCYGEFIGFEDYILKPTDILNLFEKYNIDKVYFGYIINIGIDVGDVVGICECQKKPYFIINNKVYTPIKYNGEWYLMEDDMYLTPNIIHCLLEDKIDKDFIYNSNDGLRTVGMFFVRSEEVQPKNLETRFENIKKPVVAKFLSSIGELGTFILGGLNK